jgi:hypothetical protein
MQTFGIAAEPYQMMCGDYKEELVALHGPNGHIASGLRVDQAKPIMEELNRLHKQTEGNCDVVSPSAEEHF